MLCACTCTYTSAASVRVLVQASTCTKTRSCDVTEPSDCRAIPSRPAAIPSVVRRVCRSLVRVCVVGQTRRRNISWRQSTLLEINVRDGGGTGWDGAAINHMHLTLIPAGAAYVQRSNGIRVNNAIRWLTWDQLPQPHNAGSCTKQPRSLCASARRRGSYVGRFGNYSYLWCRGFGD